MVLSSGGCKVPWALRGLCEADAAVATAYAGGIRHCETSAHAGRGNPFSPRMGTDSHVGLLRPPRNDRISPARAAWIAAALCGKTTPWSSRSLPRKRSFHRPGDGVCVRNAFWSKPCFSKISKQGLAISHEIGYTVCMVKRKATVSRLLQQAIWKQSFFIARRIRHWCALRSRF